MTEIPTMACDAPGCRNGIAPRPNDCRALPCTHCHGTGLVHRPPLTPDEIAALPDGVKVVVDFDGDVFTATVRPTAGACFSRRDLLDGRVWLADDDGEG